MDNLLKVIFTPKDDAQRYITWILIAGLVILTVAMPEQFLSLGNWQSMAFQMPILGILALAMAVTMITGGINLSIIATTNACAIIMASTLQAGYGLSIAFIAGLATATVIGLMTGVLVAYFRVSPILATLGTMTALQGFNIIISKGGVISGFSANVLFFGNGSIAGIPVPLLVFLVLCFLMWVLWEHTPLGRSMFLIGSNEEATAFSGINTRRVQIAVYVISSALCAVAALVMMAKFNSAKAGYGESYLLATILVAVLGGINPDGGSGRIITLILALIVLQMMESGLNLLGVSSHLSMALWGIVLIAYIALMRRNQP